MTRAPRRPSHPDRGATLVEVMIVMVIMGVLAAIAAPSYHRCVEQGRADLAAGQLRALWAAGRVWRLDHPEPADPATLAAAGLIDPTIASADGPYRFEIAAVADPGAFEARAVRVGGSSWAGTLSIDESGIVDGAISRAGAAPIRPGYQFLER